MLLQSVVCKIHSLSTRNGCQVLTTHRTSNLFNATYRVAQKSKLYFYCKFPAECNSQRIFKNVPYSLKYPAEYDRSLFWATLYVSSIV